MIMEQTGGKSLRDVLCAVAMGLFRINRYCRNDFRKATLFSICKYAANPPKVSQR